MSVTAEELAALRQRLIEAEREALYQRRRADRYELRAEAKRQRSFSNLSSIGAELDGVAPRFWEVVRENARRREADGRVCWSLEEWQAFIVSARDPTQHHLDSHGVYSNALVRTVRNVETMIADRKSAEEIRRANLFLANRAAAEIAEQNARSRRIDAEIGAREKRARLDEQLAVERVRAEARRLAREESDGRGGASRRRRPADEFMPERESEGELQIR